MTQLRPVLPVTSAPRVLFAPMMAEGGVLTFVLTQPVSCTPVQGVALCEGEGVRQAPFCPVLCELSGGTLWRTHCQDGQLAFQVSL